MLKENEKIELSGEEAIDILKEINNEVLIIQSDKDKIVSLENAKEIYETIKSMHSYECFEFAVYNITSINEKYLNWIDKEIK